jgi:hypothetical protein
VGRKEAVLFWKKEPKNFSHLDRVYVQVPAQMDESLFASFSSEKEDSFLLSDVAPRPAVGLELGLGAADADIGQHAVVEAAQVAAGDLVAQGHGIGAAEAAPGNAQGNDQMRGAMDDGAGEGGGREMGRHGGILQGLPTPVICSHLHNKRNELR